MLIALIFVGNRITKMEGLETLVALEELYLSHNGLTEIGGLEKNVCRLWILLLTASLTDRHIAFPIGEPHHARHCQQQDHPDPDRRARDADPPRRALGALASHAHFAVDPVSRIISHRQTTTRSIPSPSSPRPHTQRLRRCTWKAIRSRRRLRRPVHSSPVCCASHVLIGPLTNQTAARSTLRCRS